jgi:excisionase family DNA binding protein
MKSDPTISEATGWPASSPVMTVDELAAFLRVHKATIYRLLRDRKIPAFKVGSDWRFNREEIDEWRRGQENHSRVPEPKTKDEVKPTAARAKKTRDRLDLGGSVAKKPRSPERTVEVN